MDCSWNDGTLLNPAVTPVYSFSELAVYNPTLAEAIAK
jgi:hypothetical protein